MDIEMLMQTIKQLDARDQHVQDIVCDLAPAVLAVACCIIICQYKYLGNVAQLTGHPWRC